MGHAYFAAWKRNPLMPVYDPEAFQSGFTQISRLKKMVSALAGSLIALDIILALIQTYYRSA